MHEIGDIEGRITENKRVLPGYYRLGVKLSRPMGPVVPGQFVMLQVPSDDVFLRRPFSIYMVQRNVLTLLYRVTGTGTSVLARAGAGTSLKVLGPLGRGFSVERGAKPVLVAGGIGIAGIHALWKKLGGRAPLFFGCSSKKETTLLGDMDRKRVNIASIDGSAGFHGTVIELLARHLPEFGQAVQIFACGPEGMFRSLKDLLEPGRPACQVAVEERMACGLGLCFGCVKKTTDEEEPYKRVCLEGPVFDLWQISI